MRINNHFKLSHKLNKNILLKQIIKANFIILRVECLIFLKCDPARDIKMIFFLFSH